MFFKLLCRMAAMLRFYFFSFIGKVRRPLAEIGCTEISHSKLRTQISAQRRSFKLQANNPTKTIYYDTLNPFLRYNGTDF